MHVSMLALQREKMQHNKGTFARLVCVIYILT